MLSRIKILLAFLLASCSLTLALPSRPQNGHIYDENRLMSARQIEFFDEISDKLASQTGIAIEAILLDDIGKREAIPYATEIAEKWRADAKLDGEILVFVALKQRRKNVIATGTAKEILPEALIEKLQQEALLPEFRKEHYGSGITALSAKLAQEIARKKGFPLEIDESALPKEEAMTIRGWIFIVVVFGLLIVFGGKARRFGFFDNMKKLLSVSEIQKSRWPEIFQKAFGDNLVSAFLHGKCLMEGFDALDSPWTVSFILKDNSPESIAKLDPFTKAAARENIRFEKFFSPAEIVGTLDSNPLEFLHIANRSVPLCGIQPLASFTPKPSALKAQCERELRELLDRMQAKLANAPKGKSIDKLWKAFRDDSMPVLYGVYFLETGAYPESHAQVLERYADLNGDDPTRAIAGIIDTVLKP